MRTGAIALENQGDAVYNDELLLERMAATVFI
jgi:hypothetical protein